MADTPASAQVQQTPLQLRELLFNAWQYKNLSGIVAGVLLAVIYFIVAGYVPAAYIQNSYPHGTTYVSLYSHVFRYSQFFGWLTILLFIPPVLYLTSHSPLNQAKNRLLFLATVLFFSIIILMIAFYSANVAPFGVRPEILQRDPLLSEHFTKEAPTAEENNAYQEKMLRLHEDRRNWSLGRYLYYVSVFIQIFDMLFIFFVAITLCLHGWLSNDTQSYEFKGALLYCSLTILVAYLWLLMRIAFVQQKTKYFPGVSNMVGDYVVMAIFLAITLAFITIQFSWLIGKYTFILSLIPLLLGVFGTLSFGSGLVSVFGKDAGLLPYYTLLVAICGLIVTAFILVHMVGGEQQTKVPQSPHRPPSP